MSGSENDLKQYRFLLERFIELIDRIPFVKPTKSNKGFAVPYRTIFAVLLEYCQLDCSNLAKSIDNAFKSEDQKNIDTVRENFIIFIRETKTSDLLFEALKDSIECCDDQLVQVLQFFKKSCSNLINQKRKVDSDQVNNDKPQPEHVSSTITSPLYEQFSHSTPFDTHSTQKAGIAVKIKMNSSEWTRLKKEISFPKDLALMLSSLMYSQDLNPMMQRNQIKSLDSASTQKVISDSTASKQDNVLNIQRLLGLDLYKIQQLHMYIMFRNMKHIYVLHDETIIAFFIQELKLQNVVSTTITLDNFMKRYLRRIKKIDDVKIINTLPLIRSQLDMRCIERLIKISNMFKKTVRNYSFDKSKPFERILLDDVYSMVDFAFIRKMSKPQLAVVKRYFGVTVSFSEFLPDQPTLLNLLKYKTCEDVELLKYLSLVYHINIVIFDATQTKTFSVSHPDVISKYVVFLYLKSGSYSVLKFRENLVIDCDDDWQKWIVSLDKWKPTFSEIWDYFQETGLNVPPINMLPDGSGITVLGIPFITKDYKTYISSIPDTNDQKSTLSLKKHGIYCIQYEDAFNFVKRQASKRHHLRKKQDYVPVMLQELLYYFPYEDIHRMIIENSKHGIYSENVSPIFRQVGEFDNSTMLKWLVVSRKFENCVKGYFTEFGSLYFEEVYDTSIDPVSESCVGYKYEKIKVFNGQSIQTHNLTPNEVTLVLASMYIEFCLDSSQKRNTDTVFGSEIPVFKETLKKELKLQYFGTQTLSKLTDTQGVAIKIEVLYAFLENYLKTYGPFAIFVDGDMNMELTRYIFELSLYYNQTLSFDDDMKNCIVNVSKMLLDNKLNVLLSIKPVLWKTYISKIPKIQKYIQLEQIPNVPCIGKLDDGRECIIQSFDMKHNTWRIVCENGNVQTFYDVPRNRFVVLEDERMLPAECIIYPELIDSVVPRFTQLVTEFRSDKEYTATVVDKINDNIYIVQLPQLKIPVKLTKNTHFKWSTSVMMEFDEMKNVETGNVDSTPKFSEDNTYDKGFGNRGSKMRSTLFNPMRKDAYLPNDEDIKLPDYIKEDENLCKLLDKENSNSIFSFIDFTGVNITADELYGTYGKIMDRNGENAYNLTYDEILKLMVNDLWNDMVTERLNFNVTGVYSKLGENIIDLKEEIVKAVYGKNF